MSYDYLTLQPQNEIVMEERLQEVKSTEEHMTDYLESLKSYEEAMEPYKESKRELKAEYVEQGWLTKAEISLAVKAYRLAKDDTDMSQLIDMVDALKSKGVGQ